MIDRSWAEYKPAEILQHLLRVYEYSVHDVVARSAELGAAHSLNRNFVTNADRPDAIPLPSHLYTFSSVFTLITGGAYRIFNVELGQLPEIENQIHALRTRLIESYPFYRDRLVHVPLTFAPSISFEESARLSDWVTAWQQVPIRALNNFGPDPDEFVYARLSVNDDTAHPAIPQGATIQSIRVGADEARHPDPESFYVMQHGHGYLCTQPSVEHSLLHLPARGAFYQGSRRLHLGTEAEILTRACSVFSLLPLAPATQLNFEVHGTPARVMAPWKQPSPQNLIADEVQRLGETVREGDERGAKIRETLGFGISAKHARDIGARQRPLLTHSGLALTPFASLRFQDLLRSGNLMSDDRNRHSLATLLRVEHFSQLPPPFEEAPVPRPAEAWSAAHRLLYKWALLMCHCYPQLIGPQAHWFYICQSQRYRGLDSLARPGSLLLLRLLDARQIPRVIREDDRRDWERPIYLVRINNLLLCSYIYADAKSLTLVPHPASGAQPITVERSKAQIRALVTGIFTPV
jgi:hypothetical protein